MPQNFIGCGREQAFLMPPSLLDWVPEDHLVWTILDAVEEMDLNAFYADYRGDGHGRPAYDPRMMVALLLYAYARGNRSSRGIERACVEDVAYRVICSNLVPDHSTIAEFRVRHEEALAELFTAVLGLCRRAGLVSVGVVAIDGTKVQANASREANRGYERIAREILAEAAETDRREDELYGDARGDELPERLRTSAGRRAALREARQELERERATEHDGEARAEAPEGVAAELDPARFVTRAHGRRAWLREGRRALEERRAREARPVPRSRSERLEETARRLEEELEVEHQANAAYEAWRRRGVAADGTRRMAPGSGKPYRPPQLPAGAINTTDPHSRLVKTVGQMENVVGRGIQVLIPPDSGLRTSARPGWDGGLYAFMRRVLSTDHGKALYRKRHATIEPVFGQMKFNRRLDRFLRRGRSAARSEWRLFGASHNLLKLHSHRTAAAAAQPPT